MFKMKVIELSDIYISCPVSVFKEKPLLRKVMKVKFKIQLNSPDIFHIKSKSL